MTDAYGNYAVILEPSPNTPGNSILAGGGGSANLSGAGSPVGVVTPTAINQFYRDTSNNTLWESTGLGASDWIQWI
jgi:hypothetical protein